MAGQLTPAQMASMPAAPAPPGQQNNLINPPSESPMAIGILSAFLGLTILVAMLRIYSRIKVTKSAGWDDYTSILATGLTVALNAVTIAALNAGGLGTHIWDTPISAFTPAYSERLLATQFIFPFASYFVKLSILLLLFRVFERNLKTATTYLIYLGIGVVTVFNIVLLILIGFYCVPRPEDMGMTPPSCATSGIDLSVASAALNMAMDLYILALPLPVIWSLNMSKHKKIGVSAVLSTGLLACICSVVTVYYRVVTINTEDPSWDYVPAMISGGLECYIGIITGCLPCLPALWRTMDAKGLFSLRSLSSRLFSTQRSGRDGLMELSDASSTANKSLEGSLSDAENGHGGHTVYHPHDRNAISKTITIRQSESMR